MTKIAIIGSGFAAMHIDALAQIPEVEITALCSRNETAARKLIDKLGSRRTKFYDFSDYREMLRKESLDAVYICLPPFLHGEIDIACSEHVQGLFLEKPVALDLDTADRMSTAFEKSNNIVSVGYHNRYRPNLKLAKDYFNRGGDPAILYHATWNGDMPPPYWWRRREMSGGQLTEQCTHMIDAIRYIGGNFKQVQATSTRGFIDDAEGFNVDDAVVLNFTLESGAVGTIQTSCFAKPKSGGVSGIALNISSREKSYLYHTDRFDLKIQQTSDQVEDLPAEGNPILTENKIFIEALQTGETKHILSNFTDAVETLKVSLAADLSISEMRGVSLSELM